VENTEDSSFTEESSTFEKKKLFWVTRYSLGKTLSKELLIEHEFANDETRHRLIELHTSIENEKKHHLLLAIIALVLNPPIGMIVSFLSIESIIDTFRFDCMYFGIYGETTI
jgi:hypothetical protein